jgi:FtsZ-binding cell division protein ZapB
VPPERFRADLRTLVSACERLQGLGKKVRYISSAVFPAEARGLCLFGAEEPQWIRDVNDAARLPYSRIFPVLDLTPTGVRRDLSRGRRPPQTPAEVIQLHEPANGHGPRNGASGSVGRVSDEMARWSDEGRQLLHLLGGWLDEAGRLQGEAAVLENERVMLADEVRRLEEDNETLRVQRDDLQEALQALAGRMTRAVDEILDRFGGPRGAAGDLAER